MDLVCDLAAVSDAHDARVPALSRPRVGRSTHGVMYSLWGVPGASEALYVLSISVDLMFGALARMPRRHKRPKLHFGYI